MKTKAAKLVSILLMLAILSGGFFSSCKSSREKAAEEMMEESLEQGTGKDAEVDIKDDKVVVETEGSKTTLNTSAKKWPDAIPDDVPEFTWGTIYTASETDVEGTKSYGLNFRDVPVDALDKYDALLKKNGFKTMKVSLPEGGSITAEKGNLLVTAMVGEAYSHVSVQIRPE